MICVLIKYMAEGIDQSPKTTTTFQLQHNRSSLSVLNQVRLNSKLSLGHTNRFKLSDRTGRR